MSTADPHRIRLRGPWEHEPLFRYVYKPNGERVELPHGLPPAGRVKLPATWNELYTNEFYGEVRFTRKFASPTGLRPRDRVELVIEREANSADVNSIILNDVLLSAHFETSLGLRSDITSHLGTRNRLIALVSRDKPSGCSDGILSTGILIGEVRLEIFSNLTIQE